MWQRRPMPAAATWVEAEVINRYNRERRSQSLWTHSCSNTTCCWCLMCHKAACLRQIMTADAGASNWSFPGFPLSSDSAVSGAKQTSLAYTSTELRSNWTGSSNSNRIILSDSPALLHFSALIGLTVFSRAWALSPSNSIFFCCSLWLSSPLSFLVSPSPHLLSLCRKMAFCPVQTTWVFLSIFSYSMVSLTLCLLMSPFLSVSVAVILPE